MVTVRQGILIEGTALPIARWTMAGSGALLLTALISVWTVEAHNPWGGFLSAFLLLAGLNTLGAVLFLIARRPKLEHLIEAGAAN